MNYEVVFNVFLGILALLGCTLVLIFWIVFREEKTLHPIYRSLVSPADPESRAASVQVAGARSNTHSIKRRDISE
jgi:hypothetical protein